MDTSLSWIVHDLTSAALITPSTMTIDSDWAYQLFALPSSQFAVPQLRTYGNTLSILEHLLADLVLVFFTRDDQDTLEGMCLLSECEEDDLGTWVDSVLRLACSAGPYV
jgi:hypothetical protein